MTEDEILKIKEHIEIHARQEPRAIKITEIMWKAVGELEHIAELENENAELKAKANALENANKAMVKELDDMTSGGISVLKNVVRSKEQLTKAKIIIKDYMIIVTGDHTTVCSVPEENRCINILKLNEQAEQFLKEE